MPNFEIYDRVNARESRGATVTIQRRGIISFSPDAYAMLGSPEAVVFLYDREERLIGFRPAARGDQDAYAIRSPLTVSAMALCKRLGIDTSESRRYPLGMDNPPFIDLKQPGAVVTSNRRKRQGVPAATR